MHGSHALVARCNLCRVSVAGLGMLAEGNTTNAPGMIGCVDGGGEGRGRGDERKEEGKKGEQGQGMGREGKERRDGRRLRN